MTAKVSDENKAIIETLLKAGWSNLLVSVWETPLSPHEKLILVNLFSRCRKRGQYRVFPRQDTIGSDTSLSESTVRRTLTSLRERGLISWVRRGSGRSNEYTFCGPLGRLISEGIRAEQGASDQSHRPVTETPDRSERLVTPVTVTGHDRSHRPSKLKTKDEGVEKGSALRRGCALSARSVGDQPEDVQGEKTVRAYDGLAGLHRAVEEGTARHEQGAKKKKTRRKARARREVADAAPDADDARTNERPLEEWRAADVRRLFGEHYERAYGEPPEWTRKEQGQIGQLARAFGTVLTVQLIEWVFENEGDLRRRYKLGRIEPGVLYGYRKTFRDEMEGSKKAKRTGSFREYRPGPSLGEVARKHEGGGILP